MTDEIDVFNRFQFFQNDGTVVEIPPPEAEYGVEPKPVRQDVGADGAPWISTEKWLPELDVDVEVLIYWKDSTESVETAHVRLEYWWDERIAHLVWYSNARSSRCSHEMITTTDNCDNSDDGQIWQWRPKTIANDTSGY